MGSERFLDRVGRLPVLGLGVSTEYGAGDQRQLLDCEPRFDEPEWTFMPKVVKV